MFLQKVSWQKIKNITDSYLRKFVVSYYNASFVSLTRTEDLFWYKIMLLALTQNVYCQAVTNE